MFSFLWPWRQTVKNNAHYFDTGCLKCDHMSWIYFTDINQTHRWPSTANKHVQVLFWCEPAGWHSHNNTDTHVRLCLLPLRVCYHSITPPLYKRKWMGMHTYRGFFPLFWFHFHKIWGVALLVFITLFPPSVTKLHPVLYWNSNNFFFSCSCQSLARCWSRYGSLCTGRPEQSRGAHLCVCMSVQTCPRCASVCARVMVQHSPVAGLGVKLCINELRLR